MLFTKVRVDVGRLNNCGGREREREREKEEERTESIAALTDGGGGPFKGK